MRHALPPHHRTAAALALSLASGVARAQCPPSTLASAAVDDARWRDALQRLRETLEGSDRPWHCAGATVRFSVDAAGVAALEVSLPSGTTIRRHVADPDELDATLQAALVVDALPALEDPTPPAAPAASAPSTPAPRTPPPRAAAPRAPVVEGTSTVEGALDVGVRVGASPSYTSLAARATVAFRIRAWALFAWARVEPWTWRLADRGPGRYLLDLGVLGLGASWSVRVPRGRVELGLTASTNSYSWRDHVLLPGQKETVVQVRVGALTRWTSATRGPALTVAVDVDVAPVSLVTDEASAEVPSAPAWSVGLAVGAAYGGAL